MLIEVKESGYRPPREPGNIAYLVIDNWDDWFKYSTQYNLYYVDKEKVHYLGEVKIGQYNMQEDQRRPDIPDSFDKLDDRFFSVGQDVSYYERLNQLNEDERHLILSSLNDVALNKDLYEKAFKETVFKESLLRHITSASIKGQFRRLAHGNATLTYYKFSYNYPTIRDNPGPSLEFEVNPGLMPPTNVHSLIGRNGVGKTHLINNMIRSLIDNNREKSEVGYFTSDADPLFANVVSVSFSAFDTSIPLPERKSEDQGIRYSYIGLKRYSLKTKGKILTKSTDLLVKEFVESARVCTMGAKVFRWKQAIEKLEADPIFKDINITRIAGIGDLGNFTKTVNKIFKRLSSGHMIVLLTITRLVETVEEQTLVLLDEPETYLHPPLLSAFIRALSDLLIKRNGVAIISTHSPVVLQEVPKSCVWKLRRTGAIVQADRLELESFGENIDSLTREVFGLEVTQSGFHKLIIDAVEEQGDYSKVLEYFNNDLGLEARALVRSLIAAQDSKGE